MTTFDANATVYHHAPRRLTRGQSCFGRTLRHHQKEERVRERREEGNYYVHDELKIGSQLTATRARLTFRCDLTCLPLLPLLLPLCCCRILSLALWALLVAKSDISSFQGMLENISPKNRSRDVLSALYRCNVCVCRKEPLPSDQSSPPRKQQW